MSWQVVAWFLVAGVLLSVMGTVGPLIRRYWLSCSIVYLIVGLAVGPLGLNLIAIDLIERSKWFEHLTEIAVIVSLYGAGMKMRFPLASGRWRVPVVLASATMIVTIALTTAVSHYAIGLPIGFAVLLAAVLAPTDPVLAAEVQLEHADDADHLRLGLTGEAGLNDGTAFPVVLLGVGLIDASLHPLGEVWWRWWVIDVVYKIVGGLLLGGLAGWGLSHAMLMIRKRVRAEVGADEMLVLGFIALIYGVALAADTYAFLAVFAAAVAMRQVELRDNDNRSASQAIDEAEQSEAEHEADAPEHAAALLTRDGLIVADTMERLVEIALVMLVGVLLSDGRLATPTPWIFAVVMVFVVRPAAVAATARLIPLSRFQTSMVAWFGVRGIGTFYYLTHAFELGVKDASTDHCKTLVNCALATVAVSVITHGITVTPLMNYYRRICQQTDTPPNNEPDAPGRN